MKIHLHSASLFAVVISLIFGASVVHCAETSIELRNHITVKADLTLPKKLAVNGVVSVTGPIEATYLLRTWYATPPPKGGRWTTEGAQRREAISLVDLEGEHLRFGWWEDRHFASGTSTYTLRIWRDVSHQRTMKWTVEGFTKAHDMAAAIALHGGSSPAQTDDSELLVTFDFAGRKLVVPEDEWVAGLLPGEARDWLGSVVDADLKEDLQRIAVVAEAEGELGILCTLVAQPLLGLHPGSCGSGRFVSLRVGRRADCSFDASFGESCSLEDTLNSQLRKEPQLAPVPTP